MSEVIAKCTNVLCGAVFNIPHIATIGGSSTISFTNSTTNCPRCGASAHILDGVFGGSESGAPIFQRGPAETADAVAVLRRLIQEAKAGKDAEEIVEELGRQSSKLGAVARNIVAKKGLVFLIAALSYLLAACDAKLEMKLDWNVMADQLYHYATGKAPYPGLTEAQKPETAAQSEKPEVAPPSEPGQTSSLKLQPSHHKSRPSKRQRRRNARQFVPTQK